MFAWRDLSQVNIVIKLHVKLYWHTYLVTFWAWLMDFCQMLMCMMCIYIYTMLFNMCRHASKVWGAVSCILPTHSCKFLTAEILDIQNFNFAYKLPPPHSGRFPAPYFVCVEEYFPRRKKFNFDRLKFRRGIASLPWCHC